jgi:hypothetical protein
VSGTPASRAVCRSGASGKRAGVVTNRPRSAPARICDTMVVALLQAKCTCPPSTAVVTSPPLL